jgi:hypothetical protein
VIDPGLQNSGRDLDGVLPYLVRIVLHPHILTPVAVDIELEVEGSDCVRRAVWWNRIDAQQAIEGSASRQGHPERAFATVDVAIGNVPLFAR